MSQDPKSLVFIGCGHTHSLVLLSLRQNLADNVSVTVIEPSHKAVYSGMLPGFVAGHYQREDLDILVENLTKPLRAQHVAQRAVGLDPAARRVLLEDGSSLEYDVASLDVGITSDMPKLPGFKEFGVPAKPLAAFSKAWQSSLAAPEDAQIAVIGAGVAGAELAMAMAFALQDIGKQGLVHLIDRGRALNVLKDGPRRRVLNAISKLGIELHENCKIKVLSAEGVAIAGAPLLLANFIVGAAGATPHDFMTHTNLTTRGGFVDVNAYLQTSSDRVFATGDCAYFEPSPLPKAGVYAVRQAPTLAHNVLARLEGRAMKAYTPQSDYLKLISLGGRTAVGEKLGFVWSGPLAWWLKDRIDTRFMERFK
ncbi:MAG: FAD-dependent oxidoreductase [Pseudomonadota bacterium]